jgi:hypothetical protein
VIVVGLIIGYGQAEAIVGTGDADMIALSRTIFCDLRRPWNAAKEPGAQVSRPKQYFRVAPSQFKGVFGGSRGRIRRDGRLHLSGLLLQSA